MPQNEIWLKLLLETHTLFWENSFTLKFGLGGIIGRPRIPWESKAVRMYKVMQVAFLYFLASERSHTFLAFPIIQ